ncbi:MAG TPA: sigma-54 dependent transcriptional regulator [Puia sp.]|jgi:two-component system NtrC family response regulator|nr:sigma-54 dependent transcriptional regulator [Puia sp.]
MHHGNVLVVEDDSKIRLLLKRILSLEGYTAYDVADLRSAAKMVKNENIDVIVCDVNLPDGNGIEFTKRIKTSSANIEIIMLTAFGNIPDSVQAMRNGAFDYITKGDDNEKLVPLVMNAMEKARLQRRVQQLEEQAKKDFSFDSIIGKSQIIAETILQAKKVALTDATVLLLGETGTGKELFARAIHGASPRAVYPFVALNCSAFTKGLLESELFGHKAGAFTGAVKDKKGLIELANDGTLFLDEIGELHIDLQAKLLRVLENSEFIKVGDTKSTTINVRIIAATNCRIENDVKEGEFRKDLFYRLNTFTIDLPPLRDRKQDIPLLADYFLRIFSLKTNQSIQGMNKDFLEHLKMHQWKGNIRELKNVMERAVILANSPQLTIENLPVELQNVCYTRLTSHSTLDLSNMEKMHIQRVLSYTKGNKAETAKLLNIGLTTLYRKIEEYELNQPNWVNPDL